MKLCDGDGEVEYGYIIGHHHQHHTTFPPLHVFQQTPRMSTKTIYEECSLVILSTDSDIH
jgi:hypothetical protein